MKPRLLITGAEGYIGRFLADSMASTHEVVRWTRTDGDLTTAAGVDKLSAVSFDRLIHAAGRLPRLPESNTASLQAENETIDRRVFEVLTKKNIPSVYLSGCSMYDLQSPNVHEESAALFPVTPYHRAKAHGDAMFATHPRCVVLRVSSPVSPATWPRTVLHQMRAKILSDRTVFVHGNGTREQDFVDLRDVSEWISRLLERGERGVFNACSARPMSMLDLAVLLSGRFGPAEIEHTSKEEPMAYARFSCSRIVHSTGHSPRDPKTFLQEGDPS